MFLSFNIHSPETPRPRNLSLFQESLGSLQSPPSICCLWEKCKTTSGVRLGQWSIVLPSPIPPLRRISSVFVHTGRGNKTLILFTGEQKRERPWSPPGTQCSNSGPVLGRPLRAVPYGLFENRGKIGLARVLTVPQESQNTDNVVKAAWAEPVSPTSCPTTQRNV